MIPHVAPPVWPSPIRQGRFAATIVQNAPEIDEDPAAQGLVGKCTVALLGLPDDTGVGLNGGRPGAKAGPAALRAALARYGVASPADERPDAPAFPRVFDAGDVIPGADIHDTHDRVTHATAALLRRGLFPIGIGGGHDLTFPFVRAVAQHLASSGGATQLDGLYIDAHLDVRPEVGSGMPFRALIEGGHAGKLFCAGLNPLVNSREHAHYLRSHGGEICTAAEFGLIRTWIHDRAYAQFNARTGPMFVSLDMDCFDASCAPGVSAVNPTGLFGGEVDRVLWLAGRCADVRCFDIMELNPLFDQDGRTARLAAHMLLSFLRGFAERGLNIPADEEYDE